MALLFQHELLLLDVQIFCCQPEAGINDFSFVCPEYVDHTAYAGYSRSGILSDAGCCFCNVPLLGLIYCQMFTSRWRAIMLAGHMTSPVLPQPIDSLICLHVCYLNCISLTRNSLHVLLSDCASTVILP